MYSTLTPADSQWHSSQRQCGSVRATAARLIERKSIKLEIFHPLLCLFTQNYCRFILPGAGRRCVFSPTCHSHDRNELQAYRLIIMGSMYYYRITISFEFENLHFPCFRLRESVLVSAPLTMRQRAHNPTQKQVYPLELDYLFHFPSILFSLYVQFVCFSDFFFTLPSPSSTVLSSKSR